MQYNEKITSMALYKITKDIVNISRELDKVYTIFNSDYSNDDRIDGFIYTSDISIKEDEIGEIINSDTLLNDLSSVRDNIENIGTNLGQKFLLKFYDYIAYPTGSEFERLQYICREAVELSNKDFKKCYLNFKKAYNYFKTALADFLNCKEILDTKELPEELQRYASDYQYDVMKFVVDLTEYVKENRITISPIVENNQEFFTKCLEKSAEKYSFVDMDFYSECEAVMFYDFELLKAGILEITDRYVARLKDRIDDASSVYNLYENIYQVQEYLVRNNKLTTDVCKILYNKEYLIDDDIIEDILTGKPVDMCFRDKETGFVGLTSNFS